MSSNIIGTLPKEYDNLSEKVRKQVVIWMIPKRHWSLLLTRFSNKGILTWLTKRGNKPNVVKEAITPTFSEKKKIDAVKKKRNHRHPIKQ